MFECEADWKRDFRLLLIRIIYDCFMDDVPATPAIPEELIKGMDFDDLFNEFARNAARRLFFMLRSVGAEISHACRCAE